MVPKKCEAGKVLAFPKIDQTLALVASVEFAGAGPVVPVIPVGPVTPIAPVVPVAPVAPLHHWVR